MKKVITKKSFAVVMVILCLNTTSAQINYFAGAGSGAGNTGSYNTGVGIAVLNMGNSGGSNAAFGFNTLKNNTGGYFNTALGALALYKNTTGYRNNAFGANALYSNESGESNIALGSNCMYFNNTGSNNIGIGEDAVYRNTSGIANIAIGKSAMYFNTTGFYNVSIGLNAAYYNSTGACNSSMGSNSMYKNRLGNYNTSVGNNSLYNNESGSYNTVIGSHSANSFDNYNRCTFLGYQSDANVNYLSNSTAIGNGAIVDASNKVVIGNTAINSIGGQVGWTTYSDQRLKTNINKSKLGLDFIMALNPVTYNYKAEGQKDILYTGLIAQEVDEAANKAGASFSAVDKNGHYWGIRYSELTVPLIKAMQEMQGISNAEMNKQKGINESLLQEIEILKTELKNLAALVGKNSLSQQVANSINSSGSILFQNEPNPFNGSTTIRYKITNEQAKAVLMIKDITGNTVKQINITGAGNGSVSIQAGELAAGTYTCTLYVNGKNVESKRMVLLK